MEIIERILDRLSTYLGWLAALCISLMMVHVCGDVILKYFFNSPIYGTAEIVAHYYMLAVVFLPLPLVEMRNAGVSVTLFYDMQRSAWIKRMMLMITYTGQILLLAMLAYQSGLYAVEAFNKLEVVEGQIRLSIWPGFFFLPHGFGVGFLVSVFRLVQVMLDSEWQKATE